MLYRRCLMSKFSESLILVCRKIFFTFSSSCGFPFMLSLEFSHPIWYFLIGNIFVQSWLIWATFHPASDHQKFTLSGYDLKNVLTKRFPKLQKQPLAVVVQNIGALKNFAIFTRKYLRHEWSPVTFKTLRNFAEHCVQDLKRFFLC